MGIGKLFNREPDPATLEKRPDGTKRLPPGQYLTKKWPVLSYEATPKFDPAKYRFKVWGAVAEPFELTWDELLALPRIQLTTDIHCVTTWSRFDNGWEGVHRSARFCSAPSHCPRPSSSMEHSITGYTTNLPLADLDDDDVMIALKHDGERSRA